MKIWMGYCRTVRKLSRVSAYIASVVTLVMSALIFVEVICRSFFACKGFSGDGGPVLRHGREDWNAG